MKEEDDTDKVINAVVRDQHLSFYDKARIAKKLWRKKDAQGNDEDAARHNTKPG